MRRYRCKRIADYLDKVADCLRDIVAGFNNNQWPHGASGALSGYVRSLIDAISKVVDPEQIEHYSNLLTQADVTQQLLFEVEGGFQKEKALADLESASGEFRALANFLRI